MRILLNLIFLFSLTVFAKPSFIGTANLPSYYRTDIRVCRKCNHRNKITDLYCRRCGSPLKK